MNQTKPPFVRPFKTSDKEELLAVFMRNVPKYFDKKETRDFAEYLAQKGDTYLTIEVDHRIVGGTGYYVDEQDRSGRITWIFFDPSYSGQGLGRRSVAHCLKVLAEDKRVDKFVVTTSQFAFGFFEKFGYNTIRTEKNYWGKGLDLYVMEMPNRLDR